MKTATNFIAAALLAWAVSVVPDVQATPDDTITIAANSHAAVAYSPSTGAFHYAYNYRSRSAAEQAALRRHPAQDARIVCWVNEGFCALALGDDKSYWGTGWEYGGGANNQKAQRTALQQCQKRTTGARIVLCLSSDGQYVYAPK